MSHKAYWFLYKHDRAKLARLCGETEPPPHDPLNDYTAALERDGTD